MAGAIGLDSVSGLQPHKNTIMNLTKQQKKAVQNLESLDHCSKVPQYALRVEFESDCLAISAVLGPWLTVWREDYALLRDDGSPAAWPDKDVVFSLCTDGPTLAEARWLIESVVDCHVAAQSLAEAGSYTGARIPFDEMDMHMSRPSDVIIKGARDAAQGMRAFLSSQFDRLVEVAEKFDAELGNDGPYRKRQVERFNKFVHRYLAQHTEVAKGQQPKSAETQSKPTNG
jgi:hypothetical protein